jgi:hypothetical protein
MKWLHQTGGYASGGNQPFEHYGARSWKYGARDLVTENKHWLRKCPTFT